MRIVFFLLVWVSCSVAAQNQLVITNSASWKPYSYLDESGKPKGLLIDFWTEWGRVNQVDVSFMLLDWNDSLLAVKNGQAQVHAGLIYSEPRSQFLLFSQPLFDITASLFLRSNILTDGEVRVRTGHLLLGVVKGGFEETYANSQYPNAKIITFNNNKLMLESALGGTIDAFISDHQVASYYLNAEPDPTQFVAVEQLYSRKIQGAVNIHQGQLLAQLDAGINRISTDELARIKQKWINSERVSPVWVAWILPLLGAGCVIAGFSYIVQLKRAVNRRTAQLLQANQALALAAESDYLTGLLNRRAFMQEFAACINDPSCTSLGLLMIDIDRFKGINDHFGHLVGDEALAYVANILKQQASVARLVTRFGGEEFCLLYSNIEPAQLLQAAEVVREAIAKQPIHSSVGDINLTVSIGVAWTPKHGTQLAQIHLLLQRADTCLYRAKNSGRNQVCVAQDEANLKQI
jgi:diguanylate cyclase (GGDEF)-like protein